MCLAIFLLAGALRVSGQGVVHFTPSPQIFYAPVPLSRDLDLNGDGVTDFVLVSDSGGASLAPLGNNRLVTIPSPPPDLGSFVAALDSGFLVSPSIYPPYQWYGRQTDQFGRAQIGAQVDIGRLGYFFEKTAFVGVSFEISGTTHYGWIRVSNPLGITAGEFVDWAYAADPNAPLAAGVVPEPSTVIFMIAGLVVLGFKLRPRS